MPARFGVELTVRQVEAGSPPRRERPFRLVEHAFEVAGVEF